MRNAGFGVILFVAACSTTATPGVGGGTSSGGPGTNPTNCTTNCTAASTASATDGVKDGAETDVDCGGGTAPACGDGKTCVKATDCKDGVCTRGTCAAPTATDQVKNGTETDVDCGGPAPTPACKAGKACASNADCTVGSCRGTVCAEAKSCRQVNGGGTCGPGEVGDPAAKHEDCCVAISVPRDATDGGAFLLDKYLITAGRMRVFLEEVNYDVATWISKNRPPWWTGTGTSTWDAMLPTSRADFFEKMTDGGSGCFIGTAAGASGAPAYFGTAADVAGIGGAARTQTQDVLDTKVMNCFRAPLFHALCAYDGGRLPSRAEWMAARTQNGTVLAFPWGADGTTEAERQSHAVYNFNYAWPAAPAATDNDMGAFLSAPGRFPTGNGPYGHSDLLGSVENMGSQPATGAGVKGDGWFQFSFQEAEQPEHPYGQSEPDFGSGEYRNHWATGARCVKLL